MNTVARNAATLSMSAMRQEHQHRSDVRSVNAEANWCGWSLCQRLSSFGAAGSTV